MKKVMKLISLRQRRNTAAAIIDTTNKNQDAVVYTTSPSASIVDKKQFKSRSQSNGEAKAKLKIYRPVPNQGQ